MSVVLRNLLHNHGSNRALLVQLGQLSSMRFLDSALPDDPGNLITYSGLVVTAHTRRGAEYVPMLDDNQVGPGEWTLFEPWWQTPIFVDNKRRRISRKDVILALANQDGGAHIDPTLNETYFALSRENSMGWMVTKGEVLHPMGAPHLATVRQIAHEVLKSLDPSYTKEGPKRHDVLMYSAGTSISNVEPSQVPAAAGNVSKDRADRAPARPGRNDACFCGSGKKYKRCHGAHAS